MSSTAQYLVDGADALNQHQPPNREHCDGGEEHAQEDADTDGPPNENGDLSYSSQMEELLSDEGDQETAHSESDEEGFVYDGADADGGYKEQLRDVLGPDGEGEEVHAQDEKVEEHGGRNGDTVNLASPASPSLLLTPTPHPPLRPFLHPTVSRLRSFTPRPSPAPSHFSELELSRSTTPTNLNNGIDSNAELAGEEQGAEPDREIFRWTTLRALSAHTHSPKASALLGALPPGSPMVLSANGYICIGTSSGKTLVFDFRQTLKCVCGSDASATAVGPVTALALSHDHTSLATGHASGHIQLFSLTHPSPTQTPTRTVPPTTLPLVASGRQEGHILGSRIVSVGFVGGRHTALVSADENGLAFYHSLGKLLFMDASDVLRILGRYPDPPEDPLPLPHSNDNPPGPRFSRLRRRLRQPRTILSMSPLPLGSSPHPTDAYHLVALLTPLKLVIVGLKPSPKTWWRRSREEEAVGGDAEERGWWSRFRGVVAWWPASSGGGGGGDVKNQANGKPPASTKPMLVYTWGDTLHLLYATTATLTQTSMNPRNGKTTSVDLGVVAFEEGRSWSTVTGGDVLAMEWLNANQIVVLTASALEVYDVHSTQLVEHVPFDAATLVSPTLAYTASGHVRYADSVSDVAHSLRVYKGKVFLLGRNDIKVGTLLTWADRVLSLVQSGDLLSAIDLTRSYYLSLAPGNKNGLPTNPEEMRAVTGQKMRELMAASARYAFSPARLTDGTHVTPDGRGVDLTGLFEGLVRTCARACGALGDWEFLWEDLFGYYESAGIVRVFLSQLEALLLSGEGERGIRAVPPRITQRLIGMHEEDGRPDLVEEVVWRIEPGCLDVQQAVGVCRRYGLWDALVYVYMRAMRDYVSPVVDLLALVRRVVRYRKVRDERPTDAPGPAGLPLDDGELQATVANAYKVYRYLGAVLSGLTYPSEEPLPEEEATKAKHDVYDWLFFGRSNLWPPGPGGKLVLTADEEGGPEPTYPYLRLLLRFDAEAFLHALDMAFEDSYLNDETRGMSRLIIVNILLEILWSPGLSSSDVTFVNIFIARNVPKYPQFIKITEKALHRILVGLASDSDVSTREDRQLAAEYLLSAYTPRESDGVVRLFAHAGFYRILRSWHRQEKEWSALVSTYMDDPSLSPADIFLGIDEVLQDAKRANKKRVLPEELLGTLSDTLPDLLEASISNTACLLDKYAPDMHEKAVEALGEGEDRKRFAYLHYLLGPLSAEDIQEDVYKPRQGGPSLHLAPPLRKLYVSLHCQFDSGGLIDALRYLPREFLDWDEVAQSCEEHGVYDAVVWSLNWRGDPRNALTKLQSFDNHLTMQIAELIVSVEPAEAEAVNKSVRALEAVGRTGIAVCVERSQNIAVDEVAPEDMWFQLLRSQIDCVQKVSGCCSPSALSDSLHSDDPKVELERQTLSNLRSLVQDSFAALMSVSSARVVSFPRLFKRLVESTTSAHKSQGTPYNEFRAMLSGMLDSYRAEGDMLYITKHLVDRDLFETVEELARQRIRGWAPSRGICSFCRQQLSDSKLDGAEPEAGDPIVVSRTGAIYHSRCLPPESNGDTV